VTAIGQAAQASAPSDQPVLGVLNPRERRIFEARRLADEPMPLDALSCEFGISRERVRQIEVRAFEKIQSAVKAGIAKTESLPPPWIQSHAEPL
jgi:RNA polymerase sigma-32 factor